MSENIQKSFKIQEEVKSLNKVIQIDSKELRNELGKMVRGSVEETLNTLLSAEADKLCHAERYVRSSARIDTRAGYYNRNLDTKAGKIALKVPKLRKLTFESSIIDRYRRREASVEEALVEMYLAGVSVRRVEDITHALWNTRVSSGTVSKLNKKIYKHIEAWRTRQLTGKYPYVFVDGMWFKRSWGNEVKNVSLLIAFGVNQNGYREILGCCEGAKEDYESWLIFIRDLKNRGLQDTQLFVSDKCLGLVEAIREVFPESAWQRCIVHFYRNIFTKVPRTKIKDVAAMLKAIHAQENREGALQKAQQVGYKLEKMKLKEAKKILLNGIEETLSYYLFPYEHQRHLRTNNPMERLIKEIRRRTKVIGSFPDGKSALMLACARLRYLTSKQWGLKRYMNMKHLEEIKQQLKIKKVS